ncbi:hypothetical protein NBRC110019_15060 [Neptunitalea chrysea]|uniref:Uncharacterized protein n=1 Tax=Neptunitalea chrysea TaxID=1647581 RepID=A0A9W6B4N0_9FLAO|nr:hypothetical protein NBRC110019_15060 [Neptunitalea chrysea]
MAILFLVHTVKPIIPFVEYALNYNYISTVLCVNKDKPKMQCNGKCHLAKMVAKNTDDNQEKNLPEAKLNVLFMTLFLQEITRVPLVHTIKVIKEDTVSFKESNYTFSFVNLLFKPPISGFFS